MKGRNNAFTLIELLVVFAIIATLLTLVAPRYFKSLDRSKEVALRQNLSTLRDALDKYREDTGKYPASLEELVSARYLRKVPVDPLTDTDASWVLLPSRDGQVSGVFDVKSGAPGKSHDGVLYSDM